MPIKLDLKRHGDVNGELARSFRSSKPFPFIVLDNFLHEKDANKLLEEHINRGSRDKWGAYVHYNERKSGITKFDRMGPHSQAIIKALSGDEFLDWLQKLTKIDNLLPDSDLDGGGLHLIERGGFLNVHVDFLSHTTNRNWSRQLNLLLYLNKDWDHSWNGALELWDKDMTRTVQKIEPYFNRCVIFNTCANSYHGHPTPLSCPEYIQRRSLALYYFRDEGKAQSLRPTFYKARPEDSVWKRSLIVLDRNMLRLYSVAKRYLGLKDGLIQKFLKRF